MSEQVGDAASSVPVALPPPVQTGEGNELAPSDLPSAIYTSAGSAHSSETTTVQALQGPAVTLDLVSASPGRDRALSQHNSALTLTVNSLTHEYSEPMDLIVAIEAMDQAGGEREPPGGNDEKMDVEAGQVDLSLQ